jgi:RNA polymerase sigma-70 factor (ECF subfamily)
MPADVLERMNDNEAAFALVASLAGTEDTMLVAAARSGNSHAFEGLVERHARRILCVAQRVTHSREDAEDVVQQTFQKAFVHLQNFEGRSSFSTWLTRIAVNEALMCLRTNRRVRTVSINESTTGEETALVLQIPDLGPSPERSYSQQERKQILSFAMKQLTPGIRTAVQLYELDERSLKESAQMMGVSVASAKSRLFRGRRKLRETLKSYFTRRSMFRNETLQINADTNENSRSPAARMAKAKTNGGSHGDVPARSRAGRSDLSVRPRRNRLGAPLANRVRCGRAIY